MERELIKRAFYYTQTLSACINEARAADIKALFRFGATSTWRELCEAERCFLPFDVRLQVASRCRDTDVAFLWASRHGVHCEGAARVYTEERTDTNGDVIMLLLARNYYFDTHHDEVFCQTLEKGHLYMDSISIERGIRWAVMKPVF